MNRRRVYLSRIGEIERKYQSLESGDALIVSTAEDPVEFMSSFYDKWAPLRDRGPSIDDWIEEDRQKRDGETGGPRLTQ